MSRYILAEVISDTNDETIDRFGIQVLEDIEFDEDVVELGYYIQEKYAPEDSMEKFSISTFLVDSGEDLPPNGRIFIQTEDGYLNEIMLREYLAWLAEKAEA